MASSSSAGSLGSRRMLRLREAARQWIHQEVQEGAMSPHTSGIQPKKPACHGRSAAKAVRARLCQVNTGLVRGPIRTATHRHMAAPACKWWILSSPGVDGGEARSDKKRALAKSPFLPVASSRWYTSECTKNRASVHAGNAPLPGMAPGRRVTKYR